MICQQKTIQKQQKSSMRTFHNYFMKYLTTKTFKNLNL